MAPVLRTCSSSEGLLTSLVNSEEKPYYDDDEEERRSSESVDRVPPRGCCSSLLARVFQECCLLARLAWRLWSYLGIGWKWTVQFFRLVLYAMLLMPGFLRMIIFYYFSKRVVRSVVYGPKPRQRLDLYFPPGARKQRYHTAPVVIYVTGGAWVIGYKAWGALLGRRLSKQGVLVACLDYRNFPQGDALAMLEDVNTGICWVLEHIHRYGGDPDGITLVGQSAGGHLAGLALIKQAEQAALDSSTPATHAHTHTLGACPPWSPRSLRAFVGVSGAFDLRALAEHLHRRGLYKELYERVMSINAIDAYGVQQRRHGEVEAPAEAEAEERARQHGADAAVAGGEGEVGGGGAGGNGGEVHLDCENRGAPEGGGQEWAEERGCGEPQGSEGCVPAGEEQQHATVVVDGGVEVQEGEPPGEQGMEKGKGLDEEKQQQQQPYQAYIRASSAGGSSEGHTLRADDLADGEGRRSAAAAARGGTGRSSSKGRSRASSKVKAREAKAKAKKSAQPQPAYELLSPLEAARRLPPGSGRDWLPAFTLIHGTKDKTVPYEGSVLLHRALEASGATSTLHLVPGKTHTSFLLEDPMRGGHDMLTDLVLEAVLGPAASGGGGEGEGEAEAGGQGQQGSGNGRPQRPQVVYSTLCPGFLCDLAGKVCPF